MTRPDRRFAAVLFDLDGVLVDTEPWWQEVRVEFAVRHGRRWDHDDQAAVMGANSREWAEIMQRRLDLDDIPVDTILDEVVDGVVSRYRQSPPPLIGDAPSQVRRIAADLPVAIASSSHPAVIDAAVDALGLRATLAATVSSDEVPAGKPAPDVYLRAASLLDAEPARCLVVEDSLNGVRAGRAAGMTVVLIPNPSVPPAGNAADLADVVLVRLADLHPERLPSRAGGR
jgi:beta-phosphoglucomutase-like phosphatase (HAD superfamily)